METSIFFVVMTFTCFYMPVSAKILGRGATCESHLRISPKFQSSVGQCDESKGLSCIDTENPEFSKDGHSTQICDCTEDYYFDPDSLECRIQVGFPCDPAIEAESGGWSDKCPQNGFCSTNLGRYGPKNAKGMCRCKDGYYVSSVWFVGGGGTVCEKDDDFLQYYRKAAVDSDGDPFMNDEDMEIINGLIVE